MAHISIREYDVKQMFYEEFGKVYSGIQIREKSDIERLEEGKKYVIKPDMLFGKRGKRGLLGINLEKKDVREWLDTYFRKQENIDGINGTLDVFLVEEIINISKEYYLSFAQSREEHIEKFNFPKAFISLSKATLKDFYKDKLDNRAVELRESTKEINRTQSLLESLTEKYLEDNIDKETYSKKKAEYKEKIMNLEERVRSIKQGDDNVIQIIEDACELVENLSESYKNGNEAKKGKIVRAMQRNLLGTTKKSLP